MPMVNAVIVFAGLSSVVNSSAAYSHHDAENMNPKAWLRIPTLRVPCMNISDLICFGYHNRTNLILFNLHIILLSETSLRTSK